MSRRVGFVPRGFTSTQLTDLTTRFGALGTQELNAIQIGTLVRNTTSNVLSVWNGVAFVAGTDPAVGVAPVNTVVPVITGTLTAGLTLTASTGTWTATPTSLYTYQWYKGGAAVAGATASTFVAQSGTITVTVTAQNGIGVASATSIGSVVP
jgi:hypothetical protein